MILVCLILAVTVVGAVLYRMKRKRMYELASLIPSVEGELPLIGIAHQLIGNTEDIMTALKRFSCDAIRNNGIARAWLSHILYFVATDPKDIEIILKCSLEKDDLHRFLRKVNGNGTIFAPVSIWRRRRKVLVPAFSPKIIETFIDIIAAQSERLVKSLQSRADGKSFSVWPYLSSYTLDSVCVGAMTTYARLDCIAQPEPPALARSSVPLQPRGTYLAWHRLQNTSVETSFGVNVNAQENPNSPFLRAINSLLNLICERIFHLWLHIDWFFKYFPQYVKHERCIKVLHKFVDEVIRKKVEELKIENQSMPEADNNYDLSAYNKSFLDFLISSSVGSKGYTLEELREEVLTLVVAGTDTSAVAIGNVLKLLAKYPDVQNKLHTELHEVFGDSERPLVKDDIVELKYLDRVIKESLRLYPPVPFIIRKILEETKLPSGRVLPAGGGVVVSIWGLHRNPKYWGPEAENFDPDRFLPDRFKLAHPCSFMPFSNGPRNCVGYQYAMISVKTALSAILRRYRVVTDTSSPYIKVKLEIMMKAVDGYTISLERKRKYVQKIDIK